MTKSIAIAVALVLTLTAPFLLRPEGEEGSLRADRTLVIISPHNETIRYEFSQAFRDHMQAKDGSDVRVDWRVPGGTSEIEKLISSSYAAAFENYWRNTLKKKWDAQNIGGAFNNKRIDPSGNHPGAEARRVFLASDVGIGIDLFFGGGEYPFVVQSQAGHLVASGIFERRPEWFAETDGVILKTFSGERFYDPEKRWIGSCLSSFGICYNTDSIARLGIDNPPTRWTDLGDPLYLGEIALADPTKSGSATKAFEMLLQQQMHESLVKLTPDAEPSAVEEDYAVRQGWNSGLNLIQRICANARYFTDSSGKIPFDVTQGNAAAGMCIDFYGRASSELVRREDGTSRLQFVRPENGSSVSVDPIAMLRGGPEPELALDFIEFVLSKEGQKIWNFKQGAPGGPRKTSLRRLPVRTDLYTPDYLPHFSDPGEMPFQNAGDFEYVADWTAPAFSPLRFIVKCMCLDPHDELVESWEKIVRAGFPPRATKTFFDVSFVDYDKATSFINDTLRSRHKISEVVLSRKLTSQFRRNYLHAGALAEQGL